MSWAMANHDDRSAVRVTKMRVAGIFISSATIRGSLVLRIAGDVVKGHALYALVACCKAKLVKPMQSKAAHALS